MWPILRNGLFLVSMDGFAFFGSCLLSGVNKRSFKKLDLRLFEKRFIFDLRVNLFLRMYVEDFLAPTF